MTIMVEYVGTQQSPLPPDQGGRFLYVGILPTASTAPCATPCAAPILRGRQHVQHSAAENMRVKLKAPPHVPHPSFEGGSMCSTIHEHYR